MGLELGQRLIKAGRITKLQLANALEASYVQSGGMLVRRLVELGAPENIFVDFLLAEGHGPLFSLEAIKQADPEWVHKIDPETAKQLLAVPVGNEGPDGVAVAMVDPSDTHTLRDLHQALGRRVFARVARLTDINIALSWWYPTTARHSATPRVDSIEPGEGFTYPGTGSGIAGVRAENTKRARSTTRQFHGPFQKEGTGSYDARKIAAAAQAVQKKPSAKPQPVSVEDEWSESVDAIHTERFERKSAPPKKSKMLETAFTSPVDSSDKKYTSLTDVLASLAQTKKADDVVTTICRAACVVARSSVVLRFRHGFLEGWYGAGQEIDLDSVRALSFNASEPSLFRVVIESGKQFAGHHGPTSTDRLFKTAVNSQGGLLIIEPLIIRHRLVALFCADGIRYGDVGKHRMHVLARAASDALERILGERQRRTRPTSKGD